MRRMHLVHMLFHAPITRTAPSWASPKDRRLEGMAGFERWQSFARTLKRRRFDAAFFAGAPAASDQHRGGPETPIEYGAARPTHDPMPVATVIAATTAHPGVGVTFSVAGDLPCTAYRRLSTLDRMSGGRLAWSVVAGRMRAEHRATGQELAEHDERYDQADGFLAIRRALWDRFAPGALPMDKARGVLGDPAKIAEVKYAGRWFRCEEVSAGLPQAIGGPEQIADQLEAPRRKSGARGFNLSVPPGLGWSRNSSTTRSRPFRPAVWFPATAPGPRCARTSPADPRPCRPSPSSSPLRVSPLRRGFQMQDAFRPSPAPTEQGDPRADAAGFRRALGDYATGVAIVTAMADGEPCGLTSNSFAAVSLDPPLVLWSIRRESASFGVFAACPQFSVNVLAADQTALSQRFAKSGPGKFAGVDWTLAPGGAPALGGAAARFDCGSAQAYDGGDHLILLGEVEAFQRWDRAPLLFSRGRYAVVADHPDARPLDPAAAGAAPLSQQLIRAYSTLAARLERGRRASGLGLGLLQARLLKAIEARPGSRLDDLAPELLTAWEDARLALLALGDLGLATVAEDGRIALTGAGARRAAEVADHAHAEEAALLDGLPPDDLAAARRVLARLAGGTA